MKEQEYNLKNLTECPLCGTKYERSHTVLLSEEKSQAIFHLTCSGCGVAMLAFVANDQQGIVSFGVATDLTGQEALSMFEKKPVNSDNVLSVYKKLNFKSNK